MKPERVRVIPPGFEPYDVSSAGSGHSGKPLLVCIGALTERKGQKTILEACSALQGKDFRLVLAGSPDEEPDYAEGVRSMAADMGSKVEIPGHLGGSELRSLLAEADILVHAARWEAYGIALAEGMWAGLPVLASRGGAVTELISDGVEGFLHDPGDFRTLSGQMERLMDDLDLRVAMGLAARKRAQGFYTWERTCREFGYLVEETAGGKIRRNMPSEPGIPVQDR